MSEQLCWLKSSYSESGGNNCVEVADTGAGALALRESERPGQVLTAGPAAFRALLVHVRNGRLNFPG
ncbi:hypothetical protein GCM10009716_23390 [Streptomyces sodiiphilus]|uniref:DUF397 domain-containing protein n=1 Tax=Streptomyces sodiiphilus TaxID=226217 RepID=A0ABN2P5H3_9ACTN